MRIPFIAGNWKMNGMGAEADALAESVARHVKTTKPTAEVGIFPPFTMLNRLQKTLKSSDIKLGGQDCHESESGAFTGSISPSMLKETGSTHVIIGHSERRQYQGETNADVCLKAKAAIAAGLVPIICIGESLEQRQSGQALEMLGQQLRETCSFSLDADQFILAYEPVWAIGTGLTAEPAQIREAHAHIRKLFSSMKNIEHAEEIRILYGGSVKAANAPEILAIDHVDGVLVGGASLKADEFCSIIDAASQDGAQNMGKNDMEAEASAIASTASSSRMSKESGTA